MSQQPGQIVAYDIHETYYPYINVKDNMLNPFLTDLRRSISSFNPFALRQVPSQDRMAFGFRWGNQFYSPNVYPNGIFWTKMFPTHYDPLANHQRPDGSFQMPKFAPGEHGIIALSADKLPRACVRALQSYRRCQWVNGESKCTQESQDIVDVCPNWALDQLKQKTRTMAKIIALQNNIYRRAMDIPEYNQGRTVADIPDKNWVHGTKEYLRPDTMYADTRYANITQVEINEAKQRHQLREEAKRAQPGYHKPHIHDHHYDFKTVPNMEEKPLYP